jgi:DNA-binding NarL/FixJ family response regulator
MSDAQIATRLGLTEATVKCHLRNIFGSPGMSGSPWVIVGAFVG